MDNIHHIGIDVGTSSVRAGLFTSAGVLITASTYPIKIFEPKEGFYEQSSENIWQAISNCVKTVCQNIQNSSVVSIGFDATCSLVALDKNMESTTVSPSGGIEWNIIMWMDHRAETQTAKINDTKHAVLQYVGGSVALEMQMPKTLWLKENLSVDAWEKIGHLLDLPDFLTWRATGSLSRSLCSAVCKWNYLCDENGEKGWRRDFLEQIGLSALLEDDFAKLGRDVLVPGELCGTGLSSEVAQELGLLPGTAVAVSIIDAHAGGLGSLSCKVPGLPTMSVSNRLALISGTSACHMAVSERPLFVPGVWGPYYSAMVPELWLNEGGQSAAGKLIDHVVENHSAYAWLKEDATSRKQHVHEVLNSVLSFMAEKGSTTVAQLTNDFHLYPDFHGNRSPLADFSLRGMISGLSLKAGMEDLALQYLACIQALAYSSRQIIQILQQAGHDLKVIHICGGLSKNQLYVQTHADVTGLPVVIPDESESVLLGAALLGAKASGRYKSIQEAMESMGGVGQLLTPDSTVASYHEKKYNVFLAMQQHQMEYKKVMESI